MENNQGMIPVMVPPQFAKFMAEFFGDKRGVLWPVGNVSQIQFALDVAQTQKEIEIEGDFFYADSDSTGVMYVKINNPAMPWIPVRTNFGIEGFPIRRIFVKWAAQAGKQINLLYGYGARIIPPNQDITSIGSIVNPVTLETWIGKNRTGSPGFMASESIAAVAGNYSRMELWNPAASGVLLHVDRVSAVGETNGTLSLRRYNVALGTLLGNGYNKSLYGTASVAELRHGASAAFVGERLYWFRMPATYSTDLYFEEPIEVGEGEGLIVHGNVVNTAVDASFEWREI